MSLAKTIILPGKMNNGGPKNFSERVHILGISKSHKVTVDVGAIWPSKMLIMFI